MKNIFFICMILFGFACGSSAQEDIDSDSDYVIREEDVISVNVRGEPENSVRDRSVRMDGKITLPMLGEIHASGKTTKQLEAEITERLKYLVRDPIVQVFVEKVYSHRVTVAGKVGRPGTYALGSPTTVLEVLMSAGGPLATAKIKKIKIVRKVNDVEVQFPFNYKEVLNGKKLNQNILLENRDWILVP